MSCAEVMYHPQPYGAPQYLPNPVAAATCPTAYYHPAPQPGQQGDIGSVVDEHFSRALGQASTLHPESAISKSKMGLTPLWRGKNSKADALQGTVSVSQPPVPGSSWRLAPGGRISTCFLILRTARNFFQTNSWISFVTCGMRGWKGCSHTP